MLGGYSPSVYCCRFYLFFSAMSIAALETYLAPLNRLFDREGTSEISINQPKEAWCEIYGDMQREDIPEFDLDHLKGLGRLIAQSTEQRISEETPLLSATLPNGYRVQVVFPPACETGKVAFSIRKPTILNFFLNQNIYRLNQSFIIFNRRNAANANDFKFIIRFEI